MKKRNWFIILAVVFSAFIVVSGCKKDDDDNDNTTPTEKTAKEIAQDLYDNEYLGSAVSNPGWTGSTSGCNAGTVPQSIQDKVIKRINYYRAMCGLPTDITMDPVKSAKCQESALMSLANNDLDHYPPSSWTCYSADGAEACGKSNLSLGNHSVNAVMSQVRDNGSHNTACGHRRWILYSKLKTVGHGSTSGSQTLWVLGNSGNPMPDSLPEFIAWPPAGYVPSQVIYNRWSLSVPSANFSNVNVTMTDNSGSPVSLNIVSNTDNGYGDNTVVWEPSGIVLSSSSDLTYHVTVSGVTLSGTPKTYDYDVIIFQAE